MACTLGALPAVGGRRGGRRALLLVEEEGEGMPVRIRLARAAGRIRRPIYRIRVQDSRAPRDGKFIEEIGTYYPVAESQRDVRLCCAGSVSGALAFWLLLTFSCPAWPQQIEKMKVMRLEHERARYWLSVGAQPTEPVARLLAAANLMPQPPRRDSRKVSTPATRELVSGVRRSS